MNDYNYNSANMEQLISDLKTERSNMETSFDTIITDLRDKLLQYGMTGTTADALLSTMEKEVIEPSRAYLDTADTFISMNQTAYEAFEANSQKTTQIASML